VPSVPPPLGRINLHPLNLNSEVDRPKKFKSWTVPFMNVNQLAAAGFFFMNWDGVVKKAQRLYYTMLLRQSNTH